ncbi:monofunctional biosynthetic peptidoglycan transglycosylase [Oceanibaculum indicum]|uniref:Biosynthetic peptidoglycan transglycosylase n=1 Tax=Oceanibaculum indicum TaxID=526216 RepID=A0A420WB05_9PROT|nr:monofunctional biosynthetic peptidoglycan transglycosylase [Oceanibaculum indicum]RKQ68112.1 monofunctional biosynthetic peptidoglycan transglycosylase [Oceanibaculum indicum]
MRRLRRILLIALAVILLLPALLVLAYAILPPPGTPLMLIRAAEGETIDKSWRRLGEISPHLPKAVVAAEDNLFCRHSGFDWNALGEVLQDASQGERTRGASTISMQLAKNLFLWPGRSYVRKGLEAYLTLHVELLLPKRRIMELYLNVAEWGPGIYGAEAAARHHFGKGAKTLTAREAALLAVALPNPRQWAAGKPDGYLAGRAGTIGRRIGQLGSLLDCVS